MPFSLPLPEVWERQRWKVKIRDRERLEPPHVTILWRTRAWRLDLRTGRFLDREPDPAEVPKGLLDVVRRHWPALQEAWDRMYPVNPVSGGEEHGDE